MAKHTPQGTMYTTDDLIRMARMGNFGSQYSLMIARALQKLKYYEQENKRLRDVIVSLEESQALAQYDGSNLYANVEEVVVDDESLNEEG